MKKQWIFEHINFRKKGTLIICAVAVLAVITLMVSVISGGLFSNEQPQIVTISKSSLEKIIEIKELATVDYTYNAVAKVTTGDEKDTIKYYVAYEGTVTAGIEFDKLDISVNKKDKKVTITVPQIKIQGTKIDMGTMEYIFEKSKYETENVTQEAYKKCLEDLEARVKKEDTLFELAKENAIASVKALFTPWIEQIDDQYMIEIK